MRVLRPKWWWNVKSPQKKAKHVTIMAVKRLLTKIWDWKAYSGGTISQQMRRLGNSIDWERERFTMDDGLSNAVKEVFVRLHEEGLIYRGKRLVNWDPKLHTAISDLEVENKESKGSLWHFRYPLATVQNGRR